MSNELRWVYNLNMPVALPDTRFRRFMMQGIMWLILGATVGAAALVDRIKKDEMYVALAPMVFDDFSVSLPKGWDSLDTANDPRVLTAVGDPNLGDEVHISRGRMSIAGKVLERIPIGDATGNLRLVISPQDDGSTEVELIAARMMPSGPPLTITLITDLPPSSEALQPEIDLIKRIAASVKIRSSEDNPQA
jgi:hypothetical protein